MNIEDIKAAQRLEREAKHKVIEDAFNDKTLRNKPTRIKGNRMLEVDHELEKRAINSLINEELEEENLLNNYKNQSV